MSAQTVCRRRESRLPAPGAHRQFADVTLHELRDAARIIAQLPAPCSRPAQHTLLTPPDGSLPAPLYVHVADDAELETLIGCVCMFHPHLVWGMGE